MLAIRVDKDFSSVFETITVPVEGLENRNCSNTIVCSSKTDALKLSQLFKGTTEWSSEYEKYCLSEEMMKAYFNQEFSVFISKRNEALQAMETAFLTIIDLV